MGSSIYRMVWFFTDVELDPHIFTGLLICEGFLRLIREQHRHDDLEHVP